MKNEKPSSQKHVLSRSSINRFPDFLWVAAQVIVKLGEMEVDEDEEIMPREGPLADLLERTLKNAPPNESQIRGKK